MAFAHIAKNEARMTAKKVIAYLACPVLITGIIIVLVSVVQAARDTNIDPDDRWAWSTNGGWINFNPAHGGVTVYADHLEGYAWGENIGWIRMGTYTGGGSHTYGNTTKDNYGVNRAADGTLSGYAWATNVGWINFDPTHGGVSVDSTSGNFDGYAWAENVGWIRFRDATYGVSMVAHNVYLPLVLR